MSKLFLIRRAPLSIILFNLSECELLQDRHLSSLPKIMVGLLFSIVYSSKVLKI
jgi:hypothetical protein